MINKNFKKKLFGAVMTTALVLTNVIPTATVKAEAGATYPTYPTYYQGVDYSPVYEYDTYVKENVDVAMFCKGDKQKALKHFVEFGIKEDRVTSSTFDWKSYKNRYADLRSAFGNDRYSYYKHYLDYGINEERDAKTKQEDVIDPITKYNGRDYSKVYNYAKYKTYPDLAKAFGNDDVALLKHFVEFGMKEGRVANETFDVVSYKNANADLRRAFGNDTESYYLHYIYNGFNEGRTVSGQTGEITDPITTYNGVDYSLVYNANKYYSDYPDLQKAIGLDEVGLLKHFVEFGMKEGREASPKFIVQDYKDNYEDLRGAFGNDLKKYYMHYIMFGHAENRTAVGTVPEPETEGEGD
ncbi:hypothetical protein [Lachnobacterium bovis]|uniref:hypothetical protein n=1 Tax=Lachnobacterium bovis TaxID=140626 RepID=UPI000484746A|nr:hypothetical protein [Lachnobacterium bovis]